jgi:gliding motility-associated-like protein
MIKKLPLLLILILSILKYSLAQNPAQNCMGAIPVCQNIYTQSASYSGAGTINELNATNQGCLTTGESNSVWYILSASANGTLVFTLTPGIAADYDFAVWDLTDKSCSAISAGLAPIRCNYASLINSSAGGLTGLSTTSTQASIGAGGGSFSSAITAVAGQTFAILVNNTSGNASGYTLNFTGSTCQVADQFPPFFKSDTLPVSCTGPSSIKLVMSENILCSSLASNGSDFVLSPPNANITSAISTACQSGSNFSNQFTLNFSSPLSPGNYTISIANGTDGNTLIDNCNNVMTAGGNISFTVLAPIHISVNTQFGCNGTPSGVITASGNGGNVPYTFKLNNGVWGSSSTYSGLSAGTYTLSVKDAIGCIDDTVVTLNPSSPIVITGVSSTNLTCFGNNNGSITVNASGGNPPFTYAVNVSAYGTSNTITGLGPGNYVVHVKDANGCIKDTLAFISAPGQILINNLNITNTSCGTNNGGIVVNAFGGTSPINYALNTGGYQTSGTYTGLASGTYTIHIKDGNNCTKDTIVSVLPISLVNINSLNIVQPNCAGNTGSITVNASGGVMPYTYSKNGTSFATGSTFNNLSSGSYTITVKDANGCTATSVAVLNSIGNMAFASASVVYPTCITTGSITVSGSGGTTPYTYAINTGTYGTSSTFSPLTAGTYIVHLKDANGCIHDTTILLNAIQLPVISSFTINSPSCSFPNAGSINTNVSSGTPPYTYSFNGGAFASAGNFSNLNAGSYTVVVKDANGCTHSSVAQLNLANTLNFVQFNKTNVGCGGTPLGSITITAGNGNPAYQYNINGGTWQSSGSFSNLNTGTYTITAKDASNCTITSFVVITSSAVIQFNSLITANSPCFEPPTGSIQVNGTVSAGPLTYFVNSASNTGGQFNNLVAGTYTVSIHDANGCKKDSIVTITSPPPMYFINPVIVYPPCSGGTGSIGLGGAGGATPYTYSLNNGTFGASSNWNNLPAGNYNIQLKDANGCIHDTSIVLILPPPIQISGMVISNAACNGALTGSISISASGGVPPYTYALNTGPYSSINTFNGLGAGSYVVHVLDSNNCPKDTFILLNNNGNFKINNIVKTQASCHGGNNGSISFGASGGASPYQFAINNGTFGSSGTFGGLTAGTYTLHATDNSGCSTDSVVSLGQPVALGFLTVSVSQALCYGSSTGSVNFTGNGGTPTYQYRVDAGAFQASGSFTNLSVGTHTLRVRDLNNCTKDTIINIGQPSPIGINNVTIITPGCFGVSGYIGLNGTGGVSPYTYAINNGTFQTSGGFSGLGAGTHTVSVKDANGCIRDTIISFALNQIMTLNSLNFSDNVCSGNSNGFIAMSASSQNPPVIYTLNGGNPQSTGFFSGLSSGTFVVHAEDLTGCFIDTTIIISSSPGVLIQSVSTSPVTCPGNADGSVVFTGMGGTGSYTYAISGTGYGTSNTFNNLSSANYTLFVQDSLNCIGDTVIFINTPPPLILSGIPMIQPFCSAATNGAISINPSGGTPPYIYAINTSLFNTSNTFQNLIQGTYTIHVLDFNGCSLDTVIQLNAAAYMNLTNIVITNVSCKFGNDGSISVGAVGGVSPYNYSLNSIPNGTSGFFANLGIGTYTIAVTDSIGCVEDSVFTVAEPLTPATALILNIQDNKCKGDSTGSITAGASGGTGPYTYSINGINFQSSATFTGLITGNYTITIKDANGCLDDTTANVSEPLFSAELKLLGIKDISCFGVNDGAITVTSSFAIPPLNYSINGSSQGTNTFYNNLSPGEYIVEIIDSIGCRSTGKYTVKPSDLKPYIIIDELRPVVCEGDIDGLIDWHAINCYPPYKYSLNNISFGPISVANGLSNGTYFIQVWDTVGCYNDTTVVLNASNPIDVKVNPTAASCLGFGDDGKAEAQVIGGVQPYTFNWSGSASTLISVDGLLYGFHHVFVTDSLGCSDSTKFEITYDPCCRLTLPNAFSPNGDGTNDLFRPILYGNLTLVSLAVYNRWGNEVFFTRDIRDGWNGKFQGEDSDVGTYFYLARYRCPLNDEILLLKGDVTLLR